MVKSCVAAAMYLALAFWFSVAAHAQRTVTVGVVIDGPWQRNDEIGEAFQKEILALTAGEFDVRFPPDKTLVSDWTISGIQATIDKLLQDPQVDVLLAMGVVASSEVASRQSLPKPVIAPFVIDAEMQGLPNRNGTSGQQNLNYLSIPARVSRDLKAFREIVPFNTVTILFSGINLAAIPELQQRVQTVLRAQDLDAKLVHVQDVEKALQALDSSVQAVYVAPLLHLPPADFDRIVAKLTELKIPSFSVMGQFDLERGLLATMVPDIFPKVARRVALNFQRILLGEKPEELPTAFVVGERLTINMKVARAIDLSPPFAVLTEAQLINEVRVEVDRKLSLAGVIREAIDENLDLKAEAERVNAGRNVVSEAQSLLLPKLSVSALGLQIDDDRAAASLGSQAERTLSASAALSQLIYSEKAWANQAIQKQLQIIREREEEQLRLDIALEASTSYLNVLRVQTFERLQKENLHRTRANLELAQVRQSIGYSGRSEVLRWESQIALDRLAVIRANSQRNLVEIALNRLLNEPSESAFVTTDLDLQDPEFLTSRELFLSYLDNPGSFRTLRKLMAQEAMKYSPELMVLDAAIVAKRRELSSANRSFWSPTIVLQLEAARLLKEGGAGTGGLELPPASSLGLTFPQADNTNWSVALSMSLPLFEGGARFAQKARASQELRALEYDRKAAAERVEQRVRSALHRSGASRAGIKLTRDAADAAQENLQLVIDAYSLGAINILGLLDAQNAALNAELGAANAIYDFMIDLMAVERATGRFFFFASEEDREELIKKLEMLR